MNSAFHLIEEISLHAFFHIVFFIPFVVFVIMERKFSYLLHNPFFVFQIHYNHTSQTTKIYLDHYFIVCLMYILTFLLHSGSYSTILSSSKVYQILFVHYFQRVDVKSNICFGGLYLISVMLWEYCENIKTFWHYSCKNKRIITGKVVRLIFF